jgi:drug/metabolite transporter (DMT)-like permease
MSGAVASFTAMAIAGRQLSHELTTFQVLFFRSLVGLIAILALLRRSGWDQINTRSWGLHLLRNVAHFGGQYGWFYGIAFIPLTEVFAIEFTVPIWTTLMATFMLKERMSRRRATAVALGFIGVLVILRPGYAAVSAAALAVLAGAFCYAISHVMTKRLSRDQTPITILFYMTSIQLPLAFIPSLAGWVWPAAAAWPWVVIVAVSAHTAHYCLTRALRLADASAVVPLDFMRLPLIAVIGYFAYGERLDLWVLGGALIVCSGTLINLKSATKS